MKPAHLDHLVLTVRDLQATTDFYGNVLGLAVLSFGENRKALSLGRQKINLHVAGEEFLPCAARPTPGSADFCLIVEQSVEEVVEHLKRHRVSIECGPVRRQGALQTLMSVYIRDPDGNLVEIGSPVL
ncbi:MAG: VOC family protein [Desulfobacterales bacterium]|nr:VOC family protein [Desulfobacterales bacterium]